MLKTYLKEIVAAVISGVVIIWLVKKTVKDSAEDIKEIAKQVDPTNPENIINDWFENAYSMVTGSPNPPGADLYDWLHKIEPLTYPPYEPPPQDQMDKDPKPWVWTGDIVDTRQNETAAKPLSGAGGGF